MAEPSATERKLESGLPPAQTNGEVAQASPNGAPDEDEYTGPAEDERGEIIVDYSYMERACAAAANAPPMSLTEEDLKAYEGLGNYSITLGIDYEEEE